MNKDGFAFVVPVSLTAGALAVSAHEAEGDYVEDARVFVENEGTQVQEDHKWMPVSVWVRAVDHAMSADEALGMREAGTVLVQSQLGEVLR